MSILGKILAGLNIIAAAAVVYLAAVTYAKHQAWQYANFRHDLAVDGLPIDDQDADSTGKPLVSKFGNDLTKDPYLKDFNLGAVDTQVKEVERVWNALQDKLKDDDIRKRILPLARIVMPLAGSYTRQET